MNNIHGARLNRDVLAAAGSGFVGSHAPDFLLANDAWSQIVSLKCGPDGSLFMIDWYDKNQCHHNDVDGHDRTNGRVFKVSYGKGKAVALDLEKHDDQSLVLKQTATNEWYARHARRILQERGPSAEVSQSLERLFSNPSTRPPDRLRILLTLHAVGALDDREKIERMLADSDPTIRAWTIQLATEQGPPQEPILERFSAMARTDVSPAVRLYLASALQRLPLEKRWEIASGLIGHAGDAVDHNLPLMYWYAIEPLAALDASRAARLASSSRIALIEQFMARRIAALGTAESVALLVEELGRAAESAHRFPLLTGIEQGLRGRRQVAMPSAWPGVFIALGRDADPRVRSAAVGLGLIFGDPAARDTLRRAVTDARADIALRQEALTMLLKAKDPPLASTLHALVRDPRLGGLAVRGLSEYDDQATPDVLINAYPSLGLSQRRDALNTLASRKGWGRLLLAAVETGRVPRIDLTADLVRQFRNLNDPELNTEIGRVWGTVRETTGDRAGLIGKYRAVLTSRTPQAPDPSLGRAVFAKVCQQCHILFDVGRQVGPDLTGSNRTDLDYLLSNVLDPSALIGKDYLAQVIATTDGRVLTGVIRTEDKDTITLLTANETITLPKTEIEERRASEQSMMPDDLWKGLSDHEIRSLVSYLASPAQVSLPPTESRK
jgi:putative heme-binding domain-containing protein